MVLLQSFSIFVLIAHRLDLAIGTTYIRDAVIIGFMANELLSIVENAGLRGPVHSRAVLHIIKEKGQGKFYGKK